jgi:hypothetical protein
VPKGFRYLLPVLAGLLLGACATPFEGEVTTFHRWEHPRGEPIRIVPADPAKRESLEFRHYAGMLAEYLERVGYTVVGPDRPAPWTAALDYGIDEGRTEIRSWPRNAVWYHFGYGRYHHPFYYGVWAPYYPPPEVYSYTVYTRTLSLVIRSTPDGGPGRVVYEGRVQSVGRSSRLAEIMPYMIHAMFINFPGESGVTKMVTVETDAAERRSAPDR